MRATRAVLILPVAAAVAIGAGAASAERGVHAAGACGVNDASLSYDGSEGAAGTQFEKFRYIAKTGSVHCTMRGFPRVTLLSKSGSALPIKVRRSHNRPVKTVGLRKGKPVAFELAHPSADPASTKPCKIKVYAFRVHTKGFKKDLTLSLSPPLRFCDKGARRTAVGRPR
ncbi:MAG: hypothetical protein QOG63_2507 [Thermoleophilaceae bacterium]|nr:hypothetical protein [Thermoleophilaceae bacterium]